MNPLPGGYTELIMRFGACNHRILALRTATFLLLGTALSAIGALAGQIPLPFSMPVSYTTDWMPDAQATWIWSKYAPANWPRQSHYVALVSGNAVFVYQQVDTEDEIDPA